MISTRQIYAYGLIAGLRYDEMRELVPGFILDCFQRRMKYDQSMAAISAAGKVGGLFGKQR